MNGALLIELANVLQQSNIVLRKPNICRVTIDEQERYCIHGSSSASVNYNDLVGKYNIIILLSFSAIDALLDYWHPNLHSSSFIGRLKALPTASPIEKVVSHIYTIMRTLRNALVHDKSGVGASESGVCLGEVTGGGKYIECSRIGVDSLITIIYLLLRKPDLVDKYSESYLVALHDCLIRELNGRYRDGNITGFPLLGGTPAFALGERKQFEYLLLSMDDIESLQVSRYPSEHVSTERLYRDQFLFRWDGNVSVIPGEVLGSGKSFTVAHLMEWKIDPENSLARC